MKKNDFLFPYEGRDDIGHSQDKDDKYQKKTGKSEIDFWINSQKGEKKKDYIAYAIEI